jgi:uncharacterized protein (TIGR03067 family)
MPRAILAIPMVWLLVSVVDGKPVPKGKVAATDHEKIQGTWVATEITCAGEKSPEKRVAGTKMRFKNDKIAYTLPPSDEQTIVVGAASMFSFRLDPTKAPRAIDMVPLDGAWKDLKMPGIYQLDADTLTICFHDGPSDGRPKDFAAPKDSTIVVVKFKRTEK